MLLCELQLYGCWFWWLHDRVFILFNLLTYTSPDTSNYCWDFYCLIVWYTENSFKEKPERLCIFGESPYKNPVTQILTCPKCHIEVPKERVLEAVDAMRFIDRIVAKNEIQQVVLHVPFIDSWKPPYSVRIMLLIYSRRCCGRANAYAKNTYAKIPFL